MNQSSLYKSADFFMVRYANLPYQSLDILKQEDRESLIHFYRTHPLFQEAIAIASVDLHHALKKWDKIPDKTPFYLSLSKYLIRMSSRATPFGLFSSVGWGTFADKTNMAFDQNCLKKRATLGAECIGEFIEAIHKDRERVRRLKVMLNPQLIYKNGRVFLNNDHPHFKEDYISIKISAAYEQVQFLAKSPILYRELEEKIEAHFSQDHREQAHNYLWELFQRNFLISELTDPDFIAHFSDVAQDRFPELCPIMQELQKYVHAVDGEKISLLENIISSLKATNKEAKNPLRVDHFYDSQQSTLHHSVQKSIEALAELLAKLSLFQRKPKQLTDYHRFFLEEYGTSRLVPFFELFQIQRTHDLLMGIGIEENHDTDIESFLTSRFHQEEIDLGEFIEALPELTPNDLEKIPATTEIHFEIEAAKDKASEVDQYTLLLKGISHQAGAMFGRFLYFWDQEKSDQISKLLEAEHLTFPHLLFVEPSFVPDRLKVRNVSMSKSLRSIQLPLNYHEENDHFLDLKDIYVGADQDKLYLFSKKHNQEIIISQNVAINPLFMPLPLRFLLCLAQYQVHHLSGISWEASRRRPFYPRVIYKNIILSPAQWHLSTTLLKCDPSASKETLQIALKTALKQYKIPDVILLVQGDNHLQLDLNQPFQLDLLLRELMKTNEVVLHECRDKKKRLLVDGKEGFHVCEFVVPLIKQFPLPSSLPRKIYPSTEQISTRDRVFFPGGDWWYAKIYLSSNDADLFLTRFLFSQMQFLEKQHANLHWFFVRYRDPGFHIRLRVYTPIDLHKSHLVPELQAWLKTLASAGEIDDYQITSYKPEIERYGGPEAIRLAEDFFHIDSHNALRILSQKEASYPLYLMASFGLINIAHCFSFDFPKDNPTHLLDGIRPYSKSGTELCKAILTSQLLDPPGLSGMIHARHSLEILAEKCSWNTPSNIADNLIHMHCNRLLGTSPSLEQKARVAAAYFIEKATFQLQQKNYENRAHLP